MAGLLNHCFTHSMSAKLLLQLSVVVLAWKPGLPEFIIDGIPTSSRR
jgi:hypothetical protein